MTSDEHPMLHDRHPGTMALLQHFTNAHLPPHLQNASGPACDLAFAMAAMLPDGPELVAGLRKLLEAKDCFVRQAVVAQQELEPAETPLI